MLTTLIYLLGALTLHFTDVGSQNGFFSLLLPAVNVLFFIFILWQLIFFYSLNSFSHDDDFRFYDLVREFWNLRDNIAELGVPQALLRLAGHLVNTVCFLSAVYYYLNYFLDAI